MARGMLTCTVGFAGSGYLCEARKPPGLRSFDQFPKSAVLPNEAQEVWLKSERDDISNTNQNGQP